jgi:hypothetical protein
MYIIDYFVSVVYIRYMYGLWLIDGDTRYSAEINSIYKKKNINKYIEYNKREREREFVIRKTQCCGINMDITPLLL